MCSGRAAALISENQLQNNISGCTAPPQLLRGSWLRHLHQHLGAGGTSHQLGRVPGAQSCSAGSHWCHWNRGAGPTLPRPGPSEETELVRNPVLTLSLSVPVYNLCSGHASTTLCSCSCAAHTARGSAHTPARTLGLRPKLERLREEQLS